MRAVHWFAALLLGSCCASLQVCGAEERSDQPLILAHYMPWFSAERDGDGTRYGWHWTMNHFDPSEVVATSELDSGVERREIASHFHPLIGPYDSGDLVVIEYHLLTMKLAGIDGVIVDWYGQTDAHDYAMLHRNTTRILQQCERLGMKFIICYEDKTLVSIEKSDQLDPGGRVAHAAAEIEWLTKYWFRSPSYVKLDGKPVLLSFGNEGLNDDEWADCLGRVDTPIIYFSEHRKRSCAAGAFDWPVPSLGLKMQDRFRSDAESWPMALPVVFPRFVDIYAEAGVSDGFPEVADREGRTFRATWNRALKMDQRLVQIATWNDWGEGTQIEPSVEFGYRDLEVVRDWRQKRDQQFDVTADDLKLPFDLLQTRRKNTAQSDDLDGVAELLADGKVVLARRALRSAN